MSSSGWKEKRWSRPVREHLDDQQGSQQAGGGRGGLAKLLARAEQLARLETLLDELVDPALARHVRVANVRDGRLILVTPVAPIATRLRLEAPRLLEGFREHGIEFFDRIETRVAPFPPHLLRK
jgi:hypothetical protein